MSDEMRLNSLSPAPGAKRAAKRVGRGIGSGNGKTAGRGHKGLKSRSGGKVRAGFEGGQMPIHMRLPKRGFNVPNPTKLNAVNLERLQMAVDAGKIAKGSLVTAASLVEAGVLRRVKDGVRILAKGELTAKLDFEVAGVSKAAVEVIEKLGGKVTILKKAIPVVEKTARVAADKAADVASSDDA